MIEIVLLASTVVSKFLVPLFKRGRKAFTDGLADEEGDAAAAVLVEIADKIWDRIGKEFDHDDEKNVVKLFQSDPEAMDKMLVKLLQKRFENDQVFYQQIDQLVEAPVAGTNSTSWQLMGDYVGAVDARNATINSGTVAGLIVGPGRESDSSKIPPVGEVGRS